MPDRGGFGLGRGRGKQITNLDTEGEGNGGETFQRKVLALGLQATDPFFGDASSFSQICLS